MKALVGAFNQEKEKALVGAFSVIVKTSCGTDGSFYSTSFNRFGIVKVVVATFILEKVLVGAFSMDVNCENFVSSSTVPGHGSCGHPPPTKL